jgi:PBP1b-binding outer membrane lipoprotein LpoB
MISMRTLAATLALPLLLAGCAGRSPPTHTVVQGSVATEQTLFPTQEAIAKIAAAPVPARAASP